MSKLLLAASIAALSVAGAAHAQTQVGGYYRSNGTYVAPHYRSSPNNSTYDNYSTKGNYNPYTGAQGTVSPYTSTYRAPTYSAPSFGSSFGANKPRKSLYGSSY